MAAVVLSGVQSGVGKSALACGIEAALRLHGCKVSRFSVGPGLAEHAPSAAACNPQQLPDSPTGLDGWLLTADAVRACLHSMSSTADISLVEGCLGMFDSPSADGSEQGSTAQLAAWLHAPVVLIIDAQAFNTPRSILALVRGYAAAGDGSCSVAGVILNKAAKQGLGTETQDALKQAGLDIAVLGSLPMVPSTAAGADASSSQAMQPLQQQQHFVQLVAERIDLQLLRQLAATAAVPQPQAPLPTAARTFRVSLGVAYDEAFFRYFQQNLYMLQLAGVQLVPFSPLHDKQLPPGLSGLLLGAGAVAQHAAQLSANAPMLQALRAFAGAGGLVIGEAGGLLYLSQSLQWQQHGQRHAMVGLFPFHTQAQPHRGPHSPSYVTVSVKQQAQHPLLIPGSSMRGLATCCCQVLEERPVGSLAATLAAATADAPAQPQAPADNSTSSRISSGGGSSTDMPVTPPPSGASGTAGAQQPAQRPSSYTYSYTCAPLSACSGTDAAAAATAAAAAAAGIEEGYTCGTVLASAVQVHYGSCPELVQHMAQRCLRVDVATVTAAAKQAAAAAAAAACAAHPPPPLLLNEGSGGHESVESCSSGEGVAAVSAASTASGRLPSPGSRALSAPNLQEMVWHQLQHSGTPPPPAAAAGASTPPLGPNSGSSSIGDAWFCPSSEPAAAAAGVPTGGAFSPARKSCSVPGEMWQLAGPATEQQQRQQQYSMPYGRQQYQQYQSPLGFRVGSCPSGAQALLQGQPAGGAVGSVGRQGGGQQGPASDSSTGTPGGRWAPPAFNVPKRWSMELQRLGSSLTNQLLQGGYRSEGGSPRGNAPQVQAAQQQQQRTHSRSNSRGMMHLPEEAPLSEAAIRILDSSLPSLLGRTHHTHIGVAVPLSSSSTAGGSVACSTAAGAPGGSTSSSSGGLHSALHTGGTTLDSLSRSSSVHEQMSALAATLAQQEAAAVRAGSVAGAPAAPGSRTDGVAGCTTECESQSVVTTGTDVAGRGGMFTSEQHMLHQLQQQQQQQGSVGTVWGQPVLRQQQQQQRFSLDQAMLAQQQEQSTGLRKGSTTQSRLSLDTPTAFATAAVHGELAASLKQHHHQPQQQQGWLGSQDSEGFALQPELSLNAGLGAAGGCQQQHHHHQQQQLQQQHTAGGLGAVTAAAGLQGGLGLSLPPKKGPSSSSSLKGMWQGGATPKAAAAEAAAAADSRGSNSGSSGSIVSLSPAATDILIALGLNGRVAGVTDACRLAGQGGSNGSSSGGSNGAGGCWQVLQLLEAMGAPWVTEAVEAATASSSTPDVVCRLVEGPDGVPRYKLDEDCIRQLQPHLVVVACDENSGDEPHMQHYQQLQKAQGGAGSADVGAAGGVAFGGGSGRSSNYGFAGAASSSSVIPAVAVPGRVRLEPHVVQRVLQRAGVWGEGRALVLHQRCQSLAEVLEFMMVLAQAAGVPERGLMLVQGLRARLRATAGRVCLASEALGADGGCGRSSVASSGGSGSGRRGSKGRGGASGGVGAGGDVYGAVLSGAASGSPHFNRALGVMVMGCTSPLSLVGFWVPEMLQLLGLEPVTHGPGPGEAPVDLTWAQLREAAPDVLVLALPGLPAAQAALHLADLASLPGFWSLPAVRAGAVYAVDHALLMRPGPGLVLGLEVLGHLVSPEQQQLPPGLPMGSVLKLSLHGGQRCRPRLVPHYMARYC